MKRFAIALVLAAATGCGASTDNGQSSNPGGGDQTPQVSAAASVTSGVAPLTVQFTGVAAGGDGTLSYEWDFGDGETSLEQSPSHVYPSDGIFTASFSAVDADGDDATATVTITVGSATVPAVTATADQTSGIAPLVVAFTATVVGGDAPVAISWNFGDGETAAEASPSHTYTTPGSYGAIVTVTDGTGDQATATVLINVGSDAQPVVSISATPTTGPAPLAVAFTSNAVGGNAPLTYAWEFGDGGTATTQNANHTYAANNTYAAKLKVTDADGDEATATVTIVVNSTQSTQPDLQLANFGAFASGLDDNYEPNDSAAHYLGDYGTNGMTYTITDAYIDPVDVTYYVDVLNFGAALNTAFYVDFYANLQSAPAANVYGDQYQSVSNLSANGSKRLYFTVADPQPGVMRRSYMRADTLSQVTESVETNNLSSGLDVTPVGDVDWFSVYETSGFQLQITLDLLPADYDVELYNAAGTKVAFSTNGGTTAETINYTTPANGLYFIKVFGYNGARSATTPYRLKVVVP